MFDSREEMARRKMMTFDNVKKVDCFPAGMNEDGAVRLNATFIVHCWMPPDEDLKKFLNGVLKKCELSDAELRYQYDEVLEFDPPL